jgi:hypothetical protein
MVIMLKNFDNFKSIKNLKSENFEWDCLPRARGVYIIVSQSLKEPKFLVRGLGGMFKGKNPNIPINILKKKWVTFKLNENKILYIGKAGRNNTLKNRIKLYIKFGQGKSAAHWGGRYIWQMVDSDDLLIYWKEDTDSEKSEKIMLAEFKTIHNQKLPFANLIM